MRHIWILLMSLWCCASPIDADVQASNSIVYVDSFDGDDLAKILAAIDAAPLGATIEFAPRVYRLTCSNTATYCVTIVGKTGLHLRGTSGQTSLLITTPRNGLFDIHDSVVVTFEGFAVDYETPPFAQGVVVSVASDELVFRPDPAYLQPDDPLFTVDFFAGASGAGALIGFAYDSDAVLVRQDYVPFGLTPTEDAAGDWHLHTYADVTSWVSPGDGFAFGARTTSTLQFDHDMDVTLRQIAVRASPCIGFVFMNNSGQIVLDEVTIERGDGRYLSTVADGVYALNNRASITVQNSSFAGMGDDAFNTYTAAIDASRFGVTRVLLLEPWWMLPWAIGDHVQLVDAEKRTLVQDATITSIGRNHKGARVSLDCVVPDGVAFALNASLASPWTVLRGNTYGTFRGAFRIRSIGAQMIRNHFLDARMASVLVGIDPNWNEGPSEPIPYLEGNIVDGGALRFLGYDYMPLH